VVSTRPVYVRTRLTSALLNFPLLQGHRENPTLPGQTYTFTCTLSQFLKITCFVCYYLKTNATHLKFADL
jgi:hypothetical protein